MVSNEKLSRQSYDALRKQPIVTRLRTREETYDLAPYFVEHVRQQMQRDLGTSIYREGFTVRTTLDSRLQRIAEKFYASETQRVEQNVNAYLARQDSSEGLPDSAKVQAAFVAQIPIRGAF